MDRLYNECTHAYVYMYIKHVCFSSVIFIFSPSSGPFAPSLLGEWERSDILFLQAHVKTEDEKWNGNGCCRGMVGGREEWYGNETSEKKTRNETIINNPILRRREQVSSRYFSPDVLNESRCVSSGKCILTTQYIRHTCTTTRVVYCLRVKFQKLEEGTKVFLGE